MRNGFTLVELVVVVMILGILAAVAAPRILGTSDIAVENSARQTLGVIRSAIESYAPEHGDDLPGADGDQATFKTDIAKYLRGKEFPSCPVGEARSNEVHMMSGNEAPGSNETATHSWAYNFETGAFYINSQELSSDDETTYDRF